MRLKQEKHLFELAKFQSPWIMPRLRRPHDGTQEDHPCRTDWTLYSGQITNADKKILASSQFYFQHPFGHVPTLSASTGVKLWKRGEPI
jgi:hypothetical protein